MTSEALAVAAEVSPSYLSEVERGLKRPSTDVLAKLAGAFGMLPSQLLEFVEGATTGPKLAALSLALPQASQGQARHSAELSLPVVRAFPGGRSQNIQRLLAIAQNLNSDDLTALLDLARHLLKKTKPSK